MEKQYTFKQWFVIILFYYIRFGLFETQNDCGMANEITKRAIYKINLIILFTKHWLIILGKTADC